ncbi:peptide/nickel transport system substrate-binding protein [Breoghania corrubedonensis]|uniref:Peptide/nickel transport system substrate-binding protein n=1 Tax=Breoghania corrubedonensis TaxID=665038 RepID=A0A2T5V5G6_9HYPH|nr:ABC transporter substrate-binding protein [Breoghania corrubedonensis]PTW58990.1 peptide/nickel transport system substrate-binding protein [Breoghania corrubedonensis]
MRRLLTIPFALALTVSAALADPVSGGKLDLIVQPEPPSVMIGITTNGPALLVGGNIYESLLRYDENLKPMPSLAKSWETSEDGLTYTFHLQEGVKWHDGKPMTSADVMFSVEDFLMKLQPRHRNLMSHVAKVVAPDDNTVVFTLKEPFEAFIRGFAFYTMPIVPKHIYEGTDYQTNPANEKLIGTGPYKFAEWKRGSYIKLVKNEDYYLPGKPYIDELYYHVIPDGASRAVAYETGQVSVLPGGSVENFDIPRLSKLANTCTTEKGWEYFAPLSWLWLNNRKPPMDNVKFRQAVMFALDREFAKDVLWNGYGKVSTGPISSKVPFYANVGPSYPHDPAKAKALLKEMGYDGKPLKLLPLPYGETWQRWAEAVKQNLADVGIPVEIESTDVAGWNQKTSQWDYDIAFTYLYQNGDPAIGVDRNYKSSQIAKGNPFNNVEGYSNPEVDKLFTEAAVAFPAAKRQELYDKVQAKLREDVPVAWLLELGFPTIYNCNVENPISTASGLPNSLRDAWIKK